MISPNGHALGIRIFTALTVAGDRSTNPQHCYWIVANTLASSGRGFLP